MTRVRQCIDRRPAEAFTVAICALALCIIALCSLAFVVPVSEPTAVEGRP